MPAVPFIPAAISAVSGIVAGKRATSAAQKRSPEELAALTGAQQTAGQLRGQGTELYGMGLPYLRKAGGYYSTLLQGNRGAMTQAVAGPRGALTDVYRGAERNLSRSNVRGAGRDLAAAELGRDRAGRIAGLITGVQPGAAAALADLGGNLLQSGQYGAGQAGNIYGNLLGQGAYNRRYARDEGERASEPFGSLFFDLLRDPLSKLGQKKPYEGPIYGPWPEQRGT